MFHDRAIAARKQTIIFNDGPNTKLAIKMRNQMPQHDLGLKKGAKFEPTDVFKH